MHVLIIFILILGLVITRMHLPRLNEGMDNKEMNDTVGLTGATGPIVVRSQVPFAQPPLYSGVW
jgi:hypothetical protein